MRVLKVIAFWLVCLTSLHAQIQIVPTVSHLASAATPSAGAISLNVSGGLPPYAFSWNPGAYTSQNVSSQAYGSYSVKVTDSNGDTATGSYHIGYKVSWDQHYSTVSLHDTLQYSGNTYRGQAVSKNTLAASTDGWFEYVLKDLDQNKFLGFADSLSPMMENYYDLDCGFYYDPTNSALYGVVSGSYWILLFNPAPGTVLRAERVGSTMSLRVNGVVYYTYTDSAYAQKALKLKAVLNRYTSSLINVGCSFYDQGNTFFPNYTRLIPTITHNSGPASGDGSISVAAAQSGTYSYTWQPGSVASASISSQPAGLYAVTVQDAINQTSRVSYHIGYKVNWDQQYSTVSRHDTLQYAGASFRGQAVSRNTLAPSADGWVEYVLKDLNQDRFLGFVDSLSPLMENYYDLDYGFYYDPSVKILYGITSGSYWIMLFNPPEGTVLRAERAGNTMSLKVNGIAYYAGTDSGYAQKALKLKAVLSRYSGSMIQVGCSFYQQGNAYFPNYRWLNPSIVHSSGIGANDGAITVKALHNERLTCTWSPGGTVTDRYSDATAGNYRATAEDSLHTVQNNDYHVGYKVKWDSIDGASVNGDTLQTTSASLWGRALSGNTLAAHTNGWLEYVLKDTEKIRIVGFLDSMSADPQNIYDVDYGFYYDAVTHSLYTLSHGGFGYINAFSPEGTVLRVERVSDTIVFRVNGISVATVANPVDAGKAWRIKGIVHTWAGTRLANVGCSFPLYGLALSQQDANCQMGRDGIIVADAAGGSPPYTYAINTGSFSPVRTFTNLAAGSYTITARDADGLEVSRQAEIFNCPKWIRPYTGVTVNNQGDLVKTASDSSWTDAVLFTAEPFRFADTPFWLSFETPDTSSVFMLGFRTQVSDSLMQGLDSALQITNYRLFIDHSLVTVVETDNDGFYNKIEVCRTDSHTGFKIQLGKDGIEYYRRSGPQADYELVYVSRLFSPARLIVEQSLYQPGSRINAIRVSSYGNMD